MVPESVNGCPQTPFPGVGVFRPEGTRAAPPIRSCSDYPDDGDKRVDVSMQMECEIGTAGTFERSRGIREFAALPEWRDKPALNMGTHSVNFCNAITG